MGLKNIPKTIHIVGIGGVGMSGLALLLHEHGHAVSGSDLSDSTYLKYLKKIGLNVWQGSNPDKISADAYVIYSSAVSMDDVELVAAKTNGQIIESRHSLLKLITQSFFTISVTGTHGKTTTSAWIADLLIRAGLNPTALIGAKVLAWNSNTRLGAGKYMNKPLLVIEADESDKSVDYIDSDIAVITNVDVDHVENFGSVLEYKKFFTRYIQKLIKNKKTLISGFQSEAMIAMTVNRSCENRWQINSESKEIVDIQKKTSYLVGLNGKHNLYNASCVVNLARYFKIPEEIICKSLSSFKGTGRRLELIYYNEKNNIKIIDDYAHHPEEIKLSLETILNEEKNVSVFWEPHRLARLSWFRKDFLQVFKSYAEQYNKLYLLPVFLASDRYEDFPESHSLITSFENFADELVTLKNKNLIFSNLSNAKDFTFLFLGAGKSSMYAHQLVNSFVNRP